MFTIYEYAGCLLAVVVGMTLLFTACVIALVLIDGGSVLGANVAKAYARRHSVERQMEGAAGSFHS
jgi:hypothetical protein